MITTATNYWIATAFAATAIAAPDFKLTTMTTTTTREEEEEEHEECCDGIVVRLYDCDDADAEDFELWWWRRSQSFPYGLCVECGVGLEVETDFLVDHHDEDYAFTCNHCFRDCFGEAAFVEATTGGQIYNLRPRFTRVWGIPSNVDPMR